MPAAAATAAAVQPVTVLSSHMLAVSRPTRLRSRRRKAAKASGKNPRKATSDHGRSGISLEAAVVELVDGGAGEVGQHRGGEAPPGGAVGRPGAADDQDEYETGEEDELALGGQQVADGLRAEGGRGQGHDPDADQDDTPAGGPRAASGRRRAPRRRGPRGPPDVRAA